MPEPDPELQATANLSPVSPSPVHSTVSQIVPALQDTVDTIDAMVAAAAAAAATSGTSESAPDLDLGVDAGDIDDIVDDDSLNDPYGEIETEEAAPEPQPQPQPELADSNDDYAKMFDSPIASEEGEGEDIQPEDVSSVLHESNTISTSSDNLINRPSETSHAVPKSSSSPSPLTAQQSVPAAPGALAEANVTSTTNATSQPANPDRGSSQSAPSPSTAKADSIPAESPNPSADIQRLVADLTAPAVETSPDPSVSSAKAEPPTASSSLPSALPSSASLPPRPPLPHSASQSYASQHHPTGSSSNVPASIVAPPTPGQPSTYVAAGAPGLPADALSGLPAPPATGLNAPVAITSMTAPPYPSHLPAYAADRAQDAEYERQWDQFVADERQYMSEAKWDRFPEGSRIFIGNLSSDKVSKRDVFDLFHRFGRLAQISLKSAYGFVQYHTVEEGRRAMENLQGIEIKGRRIHLEVSRAQDKSKKERPRSPDRGRGREGGRRNERYGNQSRDDYRPGGRSHSPRRNDYQRDDGYGRDRGFYDGSRSRNRSRSPGYGRNEKECYRRRSPSPHGRSRNEGGDIDLPRRYGADVPDVQIILQPDINKDFVNWVEGAFKAKGLRSAVMYLHPRIPKDSVVQRQAAEGVHAVVDLDLRAQNVGRIPVQAFDRSGGASNVRFDQYVDLDPQTAAEVILRAKASGAVASNYAQPYGGGSYGNPYGGHPQQHASTFAGVQPQGQYPPQQPAANPVDVASIMAQMDNNSLQRLLSQIQSNPQAGLGAAAPQSGPHAGNQQVDIQAILGSLTGNSAPQQQAAAQGPYGAPYGVQPSNGAPSNADPGAQAAQVQNIMAQLARYRQ